MTSSKRKLKYIKEEDLQIDIYKLDDDSVLAGCSAVRVTHLPSGKISCAAGSFVITTNGITMDVSENVRVAVKDLEKQLKKENTKNKWTCKCEHCEEIIKFEEEISNDSSYDSIGARTLASCLCDHCFQRRMI